MAITKIRGNNQIKDLSINNNQIATNAGIETSKLAEGQELLKRDGSVPLTGDLDAGGNKIENLAAPVADNDAVRKVDLDSAVTDLEGQISEANVDLSALENRVDIAEGDIVALEGRMDTAESDIVAAEGRLDLVESKNVEQDGRLDTAESDIVALEGDLAQEIIDRAAGDVQAVSDANAYTDQKITDLVNGAPAVLDTLKELADALDNDENFASTIAGQIGDLDSRLDTAESDIVALEGRMDTAESDIVAAEGRLDLVESKNVEQDGRLDTAESDIVALEGRMDTAEADIVAAEGRLDLVESKNVEQDGRLDTAEADIVALEGRMDTAEADIVALEAADVLLDGRLDALELLKDAQMVYVSKNGNDSTGNGGEHAPYLTIQAAMASITDASTSKRYVIKVKTGVYTEVGVLNIKPNVFIVGEHLYQTRIGATSFAMDASFTGSSDHRSGFSNCTISNACDFNWQTVTSAAGKLYFVDVQFISTVAMYGHNNAIAQAQFLNCIFYNTFTVSGINVAIHRNNIHYANITLNQHPNGGMATILAADGGVCSGTVTLNATTDNFGRRCSVFARSFYMEYLTVNGPSAYCDLTDNSVPRDVARVTKSNGGNIVYINTLSPVDTNSRNQGEPGKQYLYNFNYVNASTGTDLYVISMGTAYSADSSGKSIFIEADSYGLNADVNGGDINFNTAAVSGTGIRGKIKIDARLLDMNSKKIVNLADGVDANDAVNKSQLDSAITDISALELRMDTAEADIVALEAADVVINGRLDVAEADIVALEGRMDTAESDIVALEGRMDTAEGDIDALEADLAQEIIDRAAGDVQTLADANTYTDQKITDLVNGAPAVLDTLKELADALGNDEDFAVTIAGQISDLQADILAEETARIAADDALDARIDVLEADLPALDAAVVKIANVITRENPAGSINGVNEEFTLAHLPVVGSEHVYVNGLLQEPNSSSTSTVTDIDWEVGVGGDFASLELALADAGVVAGDNILIKNGTYTVSSQIDITKGVRIFGESQAGVIFETAATSGAPVNMFSVSANDVVMKDLTIKHKKTSNTSIETAVVVSGGGFPQTRVSGFMMDNCVVEFMEFAVTVRGSNWKIVNSNLSYTGPNNSTRRSIGIYGIDGTCYVKGNSINNNASTGSLRFCTLLSTTGSNPNETYIGTLVVEDNIQVSGALAQFISQDAWQGSANGFNLIVKNNNVNETSAFISFYGTVANFGNILNEVTVSGNTLSNLHGGSPAGGKGIIGVDGAGLVAFRSSSLPVHASSNTLTNLVFRADYAEAAGSSGSVAGYSTVNIGSASISQDAVIGSSPTAPVTPEAVSVVTVVVENDYEILDDLITFNSAPSIGDRIRVSYIKQ